MLTKIIQIIAFSLLPLLGVLFFGWDWREVLVLYWLENITVGLVTFISILRTKDKISATPTGAIEFNNPKAKDNPVGRSFLAGFFSIHYGMFTLVHGIFVFVVILGFFGGSQPGADSLQWGQLLLIWLGVTAVRVGMAVTGALPEQPADKLLFFPYKRIIALHLTIILGIFLIIMLQLPAVAAILLIVLHAVIDLVSVKSFK